jgi:hypothetical protein
MAWLARNEYRRALLNRIGCGQESFLPFSRTVFGFATFLLALRDSGDPPTLEEAHHEGNGGQHQQDVEKSAQGVGAHEAKSPENEKDDRNSPQHEDSFRERTLVCRAFAWLTAVQVRGRTETRTFGGFVASLLTAHPVTEIRLSTLVASVAPSRGVTRRPGRLARLHHDRLRTFTSVRGRAVTRWGR